MAKEELTLIIYSYSSNINDGVVMVMLEHQKTEIKEIMEQLQPWSPESYVTSCMYCHSSKFVLLHNIWVILT